MTIKALFTASAVLLSTAAWAQDSTSHEGHTATMDMSQPVGDQGRPARPSRRPTQKCTPTWR